MVDMKNYINIFLNSMEKLDRAYNKLLDCSLGSRVTSLPTEKQYLVGVLAGIFLLRKMSYIMYGNGCPYPCSVVFCLWRTLPQISESPSFLSIFLYIFRSNCLKYRALPCKFLIAVEEKEEELIDLLSKIVQVIKRTFLLGQ